MIQALWRLLSAGLSCLRLQGLGNPAPGPAPPPAGAGESRHRQQMLIVLAIFLAPVVLGTLAYFLGIHPSGTTNYGQLVVPPRPMPALNLAAADGNPAAAAVFRGKWSLVQIGAAQCDELCRRQLVLSRQLRIALGKDASRVQRIYIVPDASALAQARTLLAGEQPDLLLLADAGASGGRAGEFFQPAETGALCLVDPLGNWMMRYPPQPDPVADFKGILKDVKKLLFQSQID
jgi:hypothetical protein